MLLTDKESRNLRTRCLEIAGGDLEAAEEFYYWITSDQELEDDEGE